MPPHLYSYSFGPFTFDSDLELPELPAAAHTHLPVRVRLGKVPASITNPAFHNQFCSASRQEFLLHIHTVASFHVRQGLEITIQPAPEADPLDVRGFLLGNMFAVLCHQRRLLPLHASAVHMRQGVVAFLGDSGAGKSTLAAFLAQSGYPLVADDICLLDPAAADSQRVIPVAPWLKLWRNSLEALGTDTDGLSHTFSTEDKFRIPADHFPTLPEDPLPLTAIITLKWSDAENPLGAILSPLRPAQAITQMMRFTYQAYLLDWLELREEQFTQCARGLEGAAAFQCERDWNFDSLQAVLAQLQILDQNDWLASQ